MAHRALNAVILLASVVLAGGSTASCTTRPGAQETGAREADFSGFVTAIETGAVEGILGRISVESHADKLVRRMFVTITAETQVVDRGQPFDETATLESLRVHDRVEIWFSAPYGDPSAKEATAERLVRIGRG